jgi:hypothetical protein
MYLVKIRKEYNNPVTNKGVYRVINSKKLPLDITVDNITVHYSKFSNTLFMVLNKSYPPGSFINPTKAVKDFYESSS